MLNPLKNNFNVHLYRVLRGYKILKSKNSINIINTIKNEISETKCFESIKFSNLIFGRASTNFEIIVRQFLMQKIENRFFAKKVLYSVGNKNSHIICKLPKSFRKVIVRNGFMINEMASSISWNLYVLTMFFYGISTFFIFFFNSCYKFIFKKSFNFKRYVYFNELSKMNFPKGKEIFTHDNVFSYYVNWINKSIEIESICHSVRNVAKKTLQGKSIEFTSSALPELSTFSQLLKFLSFGLFIIMEAFVSLICGRWWNVIMLNEAWKRIVIKINKPENLACDYLFHNSSWIYRPLWTYEAERKGSRILFYFYSTNIEGFKQSDKYLAPYFGWKTSTWPHFLVWDEFQYDYIKNSISQNVKISITSPLNFHYPQNSLPSLPNNYFAVFDVQPARDSFYCSLGITFDYFTPENCNQFLTDILDVLQITKNEMVLKRKRDMGKLIHYKYLNLLNQCESQPYFNSIDPNATAQQLIVNSKAVISMPFTATAVIAKSMGKPSVYYDPNRIIQKDDKGAHGIPILTGKKELYDWVTSLMASKDIKKLDNAQKD